MKRKLLLSGCTFAIGMLLAVQAMAAEPIRICSVDDRSGAAADTGNESFRGLLLAVDEANAAGGVAGHPIEIIEYDGKTDPQLTASFAARCAEDDGALMIHGGNVAAAAAAITPVANEYGIPYFMMSAGTNNLTDNPAPYLFRFGPRNAQDAAAYVELLAEQGFKRVAIIHVSLPFGMDSARDAQELMTAKGIKIVAQESYDPAAADLSPQVLNVRDADPEVIVLFPYPADGGRLLRTIRQLGVDLPIVVTRSGLLKTLRDIAGSAADGMIIPNTVDTDRPDVQAFFDAYTKKFGEKTQPTLYPIIGYDGAKLALEVAARPEVLTAIDAGDIEAARTAFRDGVLAMGTWQGLQGNEDAAYRFADDQRHGSPDSGWFTFITVANGGKDLVKPDLTSFHP